MRTSPWVAYGLGLVVPLILIVVILSADAAEGPKTAYVGVLAVIPMLAAVFASPAITGLVALITWLSAFGFGNLASDGNVAAQRVRLIIIALSGLIAIGAAYLRRRQERALVSALGQAAAAEQLRQQAQTDQLTGLANRRGLVDRIEGADRTIERTIALIDCDELKQVNDRLGHIGGDIYLQAVAGRLAGSLSKADMIARWGGDEFIVVQRLAMDEAMPTLHRMHTAINGSPLSIDGTMLQGSVSIGVAPWPVGTPFDDALSAADRALYDAKSRGRNQVVTVS